MKTNAKFEIIAVFLLFFSVVPFLNCEADRYDVSTEARLNVFLTGLSIDYSIKMRTLNLQEYKFLTNQRNTLEAAWTDFREFINNPAARETISGWYANLDGIKDHYLRRQVAFLSRLFLVNTIDFHKPIMDVRLNLFQEFLNLGINVEGKRLTLPQAVNRCILADSAERRSIYNEICNKTEPFKRKFIKIVRDRNRAAKESGYTDYSELVFQAEEINPQEFDEFLIELEKATAPSYKAHLDKLAAGNDQAYIDLPGLFNTTRDIKKDMPSVDELSGEIEMELKQIGVNRSGKIEISVAKTSALPYGFTVIIPGDYRFFLPEGCDVYSYHRNFLFNYCRGIYYNRLTDAKTILSGFEGVIGSASRVNNHTAAYLILMTLLAKAKTEATRIMNPDPVYELYDLRRKLMMADFEWSLYADPSLDADGLYRQLAEKYLLVKMPPSIQTDWAADFYLINKPFHYTCELLAEAAACQIYAALEQKLRKVSSDKTRYGQWFKMYVFRYGELYSWQRKIQDISGKKLDVEELIRFLHLN